MSSSDDTTRTPTTVRALACLVAGLRDAARAVSDVLAAEPALLAEVPDETLEALTLELHDAVDAATASATVVTGRLEREVGGVRGKLIAGRYASTARFLECEGHLSPAAARATVARGRDLHTHSTRVADAWLAGDIPGGAVQALTLGVSDVLRRSARADRPVARDEALDRLLPVAKERDVRRLGREVATLLLHVDPDGTTEDALFAFENQSLSIVDAGTMFKISGWLTPETAVAAKTTLEAVSRQIATEQVGEVAHEPDCDAVLEAGSSCTCGEVDRARRAAGLRHDVLMARAFDEVMRDRLDGASLGSHHGVAPHITVVADISDAAAPVIGRMAVPGTDDDVLIGEVTLDRLLCDSDVTRVLTVEASSPEASGAPALTPDGFLAAVVTSLEGIGRAVLYVGRSERLVPARLRRALEVRDGHCVFPGCRARPSRCHAHHVRPWQRGGTTDLPNTALVCITHHHAVHEGGWTMSLRDGFTGHERGCWEFEPPPTVRRRRPRP